MTTTFWIIASVAGWLAIGAALYIPAARSWRRRWGSGPHNKPPFGDLLGMAFGPIALGCLLAEWDINIRNRGGDQ